MGLFILKCLIRIVDFCEFVLLCEFLSVVFVEMSTYLKIIKGNNYEFLFLNKTLISTIICKT